MTTKEAANKFWKRYQHALEKGWLSCVGVRENTLIVMIRHENYDYKMARQQIGDTYEGFDVEWVYCGQITLC